MNDDGYVNDYEKMMNTVEEYEIIILQDYNGAHYGDIITVTRGLYNTLINKGMGMSVIDYQDVKGNQRLVNTAKNCQDENDRLYKAQSELLNTIDELKERITALEKCKDKRTMKKKYPNKMVKRQTIENK